MNNFWFGDNSIEEQEIVLVRDGDRKVKGVSLFVMADCHTGVEIVLELPELLKCIEDLENEE